MLCSFSLYLCLVLVQIYANHIRLLGIYTTSLIPETNGITLEALSGEYPNSTKSNNVGELVYIISADPPTARCQGLESSTKQHSEGT